MKRLMLSTMIGATALFLSACNGSDSPSTNKVPDFVRGEISQTSYDGITDDLLTAGLGASGLAGAAPVFADALNPTSAERRQLAIYNNYRALVDTVPGGGYGVFFGPQVDASGEGLIPGTEYLALMTVSGSTVPVTVMAQVPDSFDPANPCMITAPSSGSRGIYGAIGTAGEWGLKKGCAVVYTDKGTGTGSHNLETNAAQTLTGALTSTDATSVLFRADLTDTERADFNAAWPDRFAWKHAHSKMNPEADWGLHVLQSVQFGFYVLNQQFSEKLSNGKSRISITPKNTLVIASSVSNGGGASVRAAEQDTQGLIDGVAVSEPNVNPQVDTGFTIRQGTDPVITGHSRSLLDYSTALAVWQGCANQAPATRNIAPLNNVFNSPVTNENICSSLANKGLVAGATLDERATDAQRILNEEFGVQPEQNLLAPVHFGLNVAQSIAMTYVNAYGKAGVEDRVCGLSLAATDGTGLVTPLLPAQEAALFSASNGIPPSVGVNIVYDDADGQPSNLVLSASPSTNQVDYGLDALLCLRSLTTGVDTETGAPLTGEAAELADAIAESISGIRTSGDLQGKPAVFVTGRSDPILPINHTSRPYVGLNQRVEGSNSNLRYYEVLNAQHLDVLNGFAGVAENYVPLHVYYQQALDLVWEKLTNNQTLPPSQVVRTTPRGDISTALSAANVPDISATPLPEDRIVFVDNQLRIPE